MRNGKLFVISAAFVAAIALALSSNETTGAPQFTDAIAHKPSPDGRMYAVWTKGHEIHLTDPAGKVLRKVGGHGAEPIFSHDGRFVAYEKLSDSSPDGVEQTLFELAVGLAIFDIQNGKETIVTNGGVDDFAPIGFSKDFRFLYFNSTRPYAESPGNHVASVWAVNLMDGAETRMTNTSEMLVRQGITVPIVSSKAIWSSDRSTAFSSHGSETGIWKFSFHEDSVWASRVADGSNPVWAEQDKSIDVTSILDGKEIKINVKAD